MDETNIYENYSRINSKIESSFVKENYEREAAVYDGLYKRHMPVSKNSKILDIGCGNGMFLYYLKNKGYENYFGIDADKSSLEIIKGNITDQVENVDAFAFLSGKKDEYDVIVMNEVLEHITKEKIIPLIKLIHIALKSGGMYICYVPNMENPFTIYTRYHDFTHTVGFTQNSLKMVLRLGGFDEISISPATHEIKGLKRKIKRILQNFVKKLLILLFEYPKDGYLSAMRIYAISKK